MKKNILFSLVIAIFIMIPSFALAQDDAVSVNVNEATNTNEEASITIDPIIGELSKLELEIEDELEDPGVLPDSPFYFVKEWSEGIKLFFTFNNEKKVELQYKFAMRRVAEVNKLIEKGKTEKAVEHMAKYENHLAKFAERVEKFDDKKSDKAKNLAEKLEVLQGRQQDVLSDVYDQVPEEAKKGILNAMENSSKNLEAAIERIEGQEELKSFRERFKTRVENEYNDKSEEVRESLKNRAKEMVENRINTNNDKDDNESDDPDDSNGSGNGKDDS